MPDANQSPSVDRRDLLTVGAQAFAAVGAAVALWPFIDQMNPNPASPALDEVKVDLDSIPPGETRLVSWQGRPVFVRNRTDEELRRARAVDPAALPDRLARNAALDAAAPATDERRTLPTHRKWLVVSGSCTHLGCLLRSESLPQRLESGLGWFCPCHAARFDLSGRLVSGPARTNLAVPRYAITGRTLVIAAR